jgi:hypothetical protein
VRGLLGRFLERDQCPQLLRSTRRESPMWFRIAMLTSKGHHSVAPPMDQQDGRLDAGEVLCVVVRQAHRLRRASTNSGD